MHLDAAARVSRERRKELLRWFKKAREAPEGAPAEAAAAAALVFPPSLSKAERGAVHKEAALKLPTESSGVDEERHITVLAQPPAERQPPPARLQHVATIVYRWAQEADMDDACDAAKGGEPRAAARPLSLHELVELLPWPRPAAALRRAASARGGSCSRRQAARSHRWTPAWRPPSARGATGSATSATARRCDAPSGCQPACRLVSVESNICASALSPSAPWRQESRADALPGRTARSARQRRAP